MRHRKLLLVVCPVLLFGFILWYNDAFTSGNDTVIKPISSLERSSINVKLLQQYGNLNTLIDWSQIRRRPSPPKEELFPKWIVITTISAPTADVKRIAKIAGWKLLVVADLKTPSDWSLPGVTFLSIDKQKKLGYRTVGLLPYNSYTRKNIGYLYAIEHGAEIIYETDDDNHPYDDEIKFFQDGTVERMLVYDTDNKTINPYAHFGQASIWPRGYPLENIAKPTVHNFVACSNVRALIQQGVVDGDPDVDAIFRLTRKDEGVRLDIKFDDSAPPVAIPPGSYTPYNCQNTLHMYDAFWGLMLPPSFHLRVTDIWRSYFTQRLLQEVDGYLAYFGPTAYQLRSNHDYLEDFKNEQNLYYKAGEFIRFLENWKPDRSLHFFNKIQKLAVDLVSEDIYQTLDAVVVHAWLVDLTSIGYVSPQMSKTVKPCKNIVEKSVVAKYEQQPSSYLRLGKVKGILRGDKTD